MVLGDVVDAYVAPRSVRDVLGEVTSAGCKPGSSGTICWILHRQTLLLWKAEDAESAAVKRLQVPQPLCGRLFIEIVTRPASTAITVLLCTPEGQLCVWLDCNFLVSPFTQQIAASSAAEDPAAVVSALTASSADQGTTPGFLAVVSTADGALHLYHGSQRGIFPRQFYSPTSQPASRQKGIFGTLGTVVKAMYDEAFDPLHHTRRPTASNLPALSLLLHQARSNLWKLLVLTPESLDCWLLGAGAGQRSTEELLWSYNLFGVLASTLHARSLRFLAAALSADQQSLLLWSLHTGSNSPHPQHQLHLLHLHADSLPAYKSSTPLTVSQDSKLPLTFPADQSPVLAGWQLQPHAVEAQTFLALAPNGTMLLWTEDGKLKQLAQSTDNRAVCCTSSSRPSAAAGGGLEHHWLVLNVAHGVLELAAGLKPPVSPEQLRQQMEDVLDTLLLLLQKEVVIGAPYHELAETLGSRLQQLGLWTRKEQGGQLLVAYSAGLVDQIGKMGPSGHSPVSLQEQLAAKQLRHNLLLTALDVGGVLPQLSSAQLLALLEHSEMLAAVLNVLTVMTDLQGERAATGPQDQPAAHASSNAGLHAVIAGSVDVAGRLVAAASEANVPGEEVLFSRPTAGAPALFVAVGQKAENIRAGLSDGAWSGTPQLPLQQLRGLGLLLLEAVAAADNQRSSVLQSLRDAGGSKLITSAAAAAVGSSWLSSDGSRGAWEQLCEACLMLKPQLLDQELRLELAAAVHLPATRHLLGNCHAALAGAGARGTQLLEQYQGLAERHLDSLMDDAVLELELLREHGLLPTVTGEDVAMEDPSSSSPALSTAIIWPLEDSAEQHQCWPQLYCCCEVLDTFKLALLAERRLEHMSREQDREADSFTYWVMDRLRSSNDVSELLGLGRSGFRPELLEYLRAYPSLLWQAQVAAGMFPEAGGTLLVAAEAEQENVGRRALMMNLAKLGAYAAAPSCGYPGGRLKPELKRQIGCAELGQALLRLQQELPEPEGAGDAAPLSAPGLAQAALGLADAHDIVRRCLIALQALSLASDDVRTENRSLWQQAWQGLVQRTDLQELAALKSKQYQGGGGEDQEYLQALQSSPLYQALVQCHEALQLSSNAQAGTSIHSTLADANHVLLTSVGGDTTAKAVVQDVVSSAMEMVSAAS